MNRTTASLRAFLALLPLTAPAAAQAPLPDGASEAARYESCLAHIGENADAAYESALAWRDEGGGTPAKHCAALALVEAGQFGPAAGLLGEMAREPGAGGPAMRAQILGQAGNAWLLAEQPRAAQDAFTQALRLDVHNADLYVDRARAHAMLHRWADAEIDLHRAVSYAPPTAEILVLRATTRRHLGKLEGARADIDRILTGNPHHFEALLERGILHQKAGNDAAAREDWLKVLTLLADEGEDLTGPERAVQAAARRYIEALDLKADMPDQDAPAPGAAPAAAPGADSTG